MPKVLNYPTASFRKALEIAEATQSLGGSCDIDTCAHKLNKKVGGAFGMVVSASQKFGFTEYKKNTLSVTDHFRLIHHAYTENEKKKYLKEAFLKPPVFSELYERFLGIELPISLLDKILIREFNVDEKFASRVSNYFVEGLKELELVSDSNTILKEEETVEAEEIYQQEEDSKFPNSNIVSENSQSASIAENATLTEFTVHIYGPGLNTTISLKDEDDLMIVEATLNKVKKKLKE